MEAVKDFIEDKLDDQGNLMVSVSAEYGKVRIDFGKKMEWLAFSPNEALVLASIIVKHAMVLKFK